MSTHEPVTFRELSYAIFDEDKKGVCTTALGHLAIFNTRVVAEAFIRGSKRRLVVIPVRILRATVQ